MKKYLLMIAIFLGVGNAHGQELMETSKFGDNWSLTLKGGGVAPFQNYSVIRNTRGLVGLELRKQITPAFGLKIGRAHV